MNKFLVGILSVLILTGTTTTSVKAIAALHVLHPQSFGDGGWAGWSCPADTHVVGGGYEPYGAGVLNSLAWQPGASIDDFSFPTTPFGYTYSEGETGWIVQADFDAETPMPTAVWVECEPNQVPVEPTPTPLTCTGDQHLDASGQNCVSFTPAGPPPEGPYTPPQGQVLGASTGKVLGASTMAGTGSFAENLYLAIMALGGIITFAGIKNFKKAI